MHANAVERTSGLGGIYPYILTDEHQRQRLMRTRFERDVLIRGNRTVQPGDGIEHL